MNVYVKLALVLGIITALAGAVWWVDDNGFDRGTAKAEARWAAADRKAEAEKAKDRAAALRIIRDQAAALMRATENATQSNQQWQEARNAARRNRTPLAVCTEPTPANEASPASVAQRDSPALTWEFVRLYDTAWTGKAGESVFTGRPVAAGEVVSAGAASPYTVDDVIDTHGENAKRCSADRRRLDALVDALDKLEADFDARHSGLGVRIEPDADHGDDLVDSDERARAAHLLVDVHHPKVALDGVVDVRVELAQGGVPAVEAGPHSLRNSTTHTQGFDFQGYPRSAFNKSQSWR